MNSDRNLREEALFFPSLQLSLHALHVLFILVILLTLRHLAYSTLYSLFLPREDIPVIPEARLICNGQRYSTSCSLVRISRKGDRIRKDVASRRSWNKRSGGYIKTLKFELLRSKLFFSHLHERLSLTTLNNQSIDRPTDDHSLKITTTFI